MLEYFQFSLLDMTPYNRQSWFNLIGEYNQAIWFVFPVAVVFILYFLRSIFLLSKKANTQNTSRCLFVLLGLSWIWLGAVFHYQYFADLNWAATWFADLFIIQGVLLLVAALLLKLNVWVSADSLRGKLFLILLLAGLFVYPLSLFFEDRNYLQLELFPLHPTPVLLISIALLMLSNSIWRHVLVIIPMIWAVISAAFALSLGLLELYFIGFALLLWLLQLLGIVLRIE